MESHLKPLSGIKNLQNTVETAKDYAVTHGLCIKPRTGTPDSISILPFCLAPSPFPKSVFERLKSVQTEMNVLMHRVAHDYEFLKNCLESTIATDDFTAHLFNMYEEVYSCGFPQPLSLGLLRSDYFLDVGASNGTKGEPVPKQIEINTISSSFGGLTPVLQAQQKHVLSSLGFSNLLPQMPDSNSDELLARGILAAWKAYNNKVAAIMFVVEEITYNVYDQRFLEYAIIRQSPGVKVIRRKFSELHQCSLQDGRLFVDNLEIAVVYYRTSYAPNQMTVKDWEIRLLIEKSLAIKCPSVQYQLAGTKKVQQVLAQPGVLERFFTSKVTIDEIRSYFTGLYSLDFTPEGNRAAAKAIEKPNGYVLKPQREGGGNNIYGEDVKTMLLALRNKKEREGFILMDLITPPVNHNYIVKPDTPVELVDIVSEIGIFGVVLGDQDDILENYEAGFILRSKKVEIREGGIAAGFGALNSILLV
ncbi:glutathione synthetase-like [Ornithodoros turicata]|uniref:glutathione synthetase-like n=1 Tax=Ornithodoros turicata TaxID=34597 RepID=UPI0031392985